MDQYLQGHLASNSWGTRSETHNVWGLNGFDELGVLGEVHMRAERDVVHRQLSGNSSTLDRDNFFRLIENILKKKEMARGELRFRDTNTKRTSKKFARITQRSG